MSNDVLKTDNLSGNPETEDTGELKEIINELFPDGISSDIMENLSEEIQPETESVIFEDDPVDSATEAEVADAIAEAVASAFEHEDKVAAILENAETVEDPIPDMEPVPVVEEIVADTAVEETEPESEPVEKKPVRQVKRNPKDTGERKKKRKASKEKKQPEAGKTETAPDVPPSAQKNEQVSSASEMPRVSAKRSDSQEIHNPGTDYVKIGRSNISVSPQEYFTSLFSGILERQKEALPPVGVDLRAHEKSLSAKTGFDRLLNPVRYVILLLMFMCLMGRKYQWMTLGFMKGIGGTYVALILTIVVMLVSWQSVYRAVRDMLYMQFSYESYLFLATLITVFEALSTGNEESLLPLLTMSWCVCGIANLMNSQANLRSVRAVITGRNRVGIRSVRNKWNGQDVIGKAPSTTAGFVRRQAQMDAWHSGNSFFLLPFMIICFVVAAYLSAKTESNYFTVLATLLDVGVPISMALCCARPYSLLSQVLSGKGVVAGWAGMKGLSGKKSVLIYDSDLFPSGTMGHKGVKVYGRFTASQLVSYGASMVLRANIGMTDVFTRLLRDADGEILEVRQLQIQESGIEGRIHGGRVQLGTYHFMQLMGVNVPQKGSTNGVYIAVNGQLAGMFAIKYALRSGSISAFRRFTRERLLTPLVVTRNFTINPAFIQKSFKASISRLSCPKTEVRRVLSEPSTLKGGATCGFVLRDGLSAYSRTVGGARRVRRMGIAYTVLSIVLTIYLTFDAILAISAGTAMIEITRVLLMHFWLLVAVEVGARFAIRK